MIITYYGQAMARFQLGDLVILTNPISKKFNPKAPKLSADIVLLSWPADWSGRQTPDGDYGQAFVIDGPGEYEVKETFIQGLNTVGPDDSLNTAYTINLEGIRIVHLGALAVNDITSAVREELGSIDILLVPTGDHGTLDFKQAAKLTATLSPKIIIPILYQDKVDSKLLTTFLKEVGVKTAQPLDKLSVKRKDLENKETEVVVLTPAGKIWFLII